MLLLIFSIHVSILSFKFLFASSQPRLLHSSLSLRLKAAGKLVAAAAAAGDISQQTVVWL